MELNNCDLASGLQSGTIIIWNEHNSSKHTLLAHGDYVTKILQINDGRLASVEQDKVEKLWNIEKNECSIIAMEDYIVSDLIQLNDSRIVISLDLDSNPDQLQLYSNRNNIFLHSLHCILELLEGLLVGEPDDGIFIFHSLINTILIPCFSNFNYKYYFI